MTRSRVATGLALVVAVAMAAAGAMGGVGFAQSQSSDLPTVNATGSAGSAFATSDGVKSGTSAPTQTPSSGSVASRTLSSPELAPGGSVTVTVTANATDQSAVTVNEFFSPVVGSATIDRVAVEGEAASTIVRQADASGVVITLDGASIDTGDTVTVEYTLSVGQDAGIGNVYEINGTVVSAETTDLPVERITVSDRGPVAEFDDDGDGEISITELGTAAATYAQGDLSITQLGEVAATYAQS